MIVKYQNVNSAMQGLIIYISFRFLNFVLNVCIFGLTKVINHLVYERALNYFELNFLYMKVRNKWECINTEINLRYRLRLKKLCKKLLFK